MTLSEKSETRITLRLNKKLSEWVARKAIERGISNNAQISITLFEKMAAEEAAAQK
ncbi:hypothetical protein HGG71_02590 [Rhodobacteraceae bacterium R_SAG2]|nr:hypothetical protein [Rhodobacteraceae bacterium R_SAG2]